MALPIIRYPAPFDPSVQPAQPQTPDQAPPFQVVFTPPPAAPPFIKKVMERQFLDTNPFTSDVIDWPRGQNLGIDVVNTHDQDFRVQVHVGTDSQNAIPMAIPSIEFDCPKGQRTAQSLSPERDIWGPFAWVIAFPVKAAPVSGNIRIQMSRRGD